MNKIIRVAEGKNTTLSHLYIDGIFQCYLLEDKLRKEKIYGQTAIPEGVYPLKFRREGSLHANYSKRFKFHVGMLHITSITNYTNVMLHIGNTHEDTLGCPLLGSDFTFENGDYKVSDSTKAYLRVYPILAKQLQENQTTTIEVINKIY